MLTVSDLNAGLDWDETPSDVKDMDGKPSKLPIHIPKKFKGKKKKKVKLSDYIQKAQRV